MPNSICTYTIWRRDAMPYTGMLKKIGEPRSGDTKINCVGLYDDVIKLGWLLP